MIPERQAIDWLLWIGSAVLILAFLPLWNIIPALAVLVQMGAVVAVIYLAYNHNYIPLAVGALGAVALMAALGYSSVLLLLWAGVVIPALLMGFLTGNGWSGGRAYGPAALAVVVIMTILFLVIRKDFLGLMELVKSDTIAYVKSFSPEEAVKIASIERMVDLIGRLMPSFFILYSLALVFIGWLATVGLRQMTGRYVPSFGKFIYWKLPDYYIFVLGGFILVRLVGNEWLRIVADNAVLILMTVVAVFGFSVIEYYFRKIKLNIFTKIIFYLFFPPALIFAVLLGIFDSYFDFRRVKARIIG